VAFFTQRDSEEQEGAPVASEELRAAVAQHLAGADSVTIEIVGAVAALLVQVALADSEFSDEETEEVRQQLSRIEGLDGAGAAAVCGMLKTHAAPLGQEGIQPCTRVLRERCDRSARVEVLDVLMDMAAVDGTVSMSETNLLRRICVSLGLGDADYLASQRRYRDRLSVLKVET